MNKIRNMCMTEYGFDPLSVSQVRRYYKSLKKLPPLSLGAYVMIVKRKLERLGINVSDNRLIAAVYKNPTVTPAQWPTRGVKWLEYWNTVAQKPHVVGSCYNPHPKEVARAWALGVPAKVAQHATNFSLFTLAKDGRRISRTRLKAAYKLCCVPEYVQLTAPTKDLVRLAKLPRRTLRALFAHDHRIAETKINWDKVFSYVGELPVYKDTFMRAGLPSAMWSMSALPDARVLAAAADCGVNPSILRYISNVGKVKDLKRLIKLGICHLVSHVTDHKVDFVNVMDRILEAHALGWNTCLQAITSANELIESVDKFLADNGHINHNNKRERSPTAQAIFRRADRRAQRDRSWAIDMYRSEYERGRRIAPVMHECAALLLSKMQEGRTVVIHGRDGELLYQLTLHKVKSLHRKYRPALRKQLVYVITSRPLLSDPDDAFLNYLRRRIPDNAIHVDTGFAGSVPQRVMTMLNIKGDILLVSAQNESHQLPISKESILNACPAGLREMVLADLEHSQQRLILPEGVSWRQLSYSVGSPGFWARLYGVLDNIS